MASSSFLGSPTDRWSLARAVDALAESARAAGIPTLVWIAGACYPAVNLNVDLFSGLLALAENYTGVELTEVGQTETIVGLFTSDMVTGWLGEAGPWAVLPVLVLCAALSRLIVGLAKVSDPRLWTARGDADPYVVAHGYLDADKLDELASNGRGLRLRFAWRAGKGLGFVGLGLWAMLVGLLFGAGLVLIAPVVVLVRTFGIEGEAPLFTGLLVPSMLLLLAYAIVLMVVNQLAMHSLAHNRRGVSSALMHAWRIMRANPMSVLRATVLDLVLVVSVVAAAWFGGSLLDTFQLGSLPSQTFAFLLYGFAGVTRAGFWARAYGACGGPSAAEHVPGLARPT